MKSFFIKYLSVLFIAFSFTHLKAQNFNVKIEADTILIGDIFTIEMSIHNYGNNQVYFPNFTDSIGKFEIIESLPEDTLDNALVKNWEVSVYEPGAYQITGFNALIQNPNGQLDTLENDEFFTVYVSTLPVDTSKAFKPIKDTKSIPFPYKEMAKKYLPYVLAVLVLAVLIFLFLKYRNRDKTEQTIVKSPIDFHAEAVLKLKEIEKKKLWQSGKIKEHYLEVSETLRTYLEGRYAFKAMESTTDEILEDLLIANKDGTLNTKLKEVLQQCDLAKFAKFKPSEEENQRMMKSAQVFVAHTKPRPIAEEKKGE